MSDHDATETATRTLEQRRPEVRGAPATSLEGLREAVSAIESGGADEGAAPEVRIGSAGEPRRIPPPDPKATDEDADPYAIARAVVLRLLTGAPKSRSELEQALRRKGCPDDVAAEVLDRYEEVGLVDDEAYAQTFVRSKQAGRGLARRALSHELRKKGVDEELAQAVLDEIEPEDERARAHELVEKKLRSMHGLDRAVQTRRLAGMLARKGYGPEVSRLVINEALDAQPEHQRD
ncbi:regulatory protein RecX [Janibacter cremeus]|uniref:Regulatory protein RecX n=1 Tax=Janibacter cremeus TaxID=1285192 RepID=A0A852VVC0_9MICO|nr:regulatory protein RecX [Janibacter cremeus]NYF99360.1 regulatory protein [Janibacter cremeus]